MNVNIGLMGHVDSGKTSIAKVLSSTAGTACFDKSPQSQSRGITLDLGFSTFKFAGKQVTIVDCPGHASLIRAVLCGAQIIDLIVLVVDGTKGIQAQTAECLIVAEIMSEKLVFAVNKIDLWPEAERETKFEVFKKKLGKVLKDGKFAESPIVPLSVILGIGFDGLKKEIDSQISREPVIKRNFKANFVFAVDHCFPIKGHGTVLTGTVLQGRISVNDSIELPRLKLSRKVKSMQSFRENVSTIRAGDRAGICVQAVDSESIERTLICSSNTRDAIPTRSVLFLDGKRIKYFKGHFKSKMKIHISVLNECVLCKQVIFVKSTQYGHEYLDSIPEENESFQVIIELEREVSILPGSIIIASKLDSDPSLQKCRIAFHGRWMTFQDKLRLDQFKIYRVKHRFSLIDRIVSENRLICKGFSSHLDSKGRDSMNSITKFIGMKVTINRKNSSPSDWGKIDSIFGSSGKFNITTTPTTTIPIDDSKDLYVKLSFGIYCESEEMFCII